MLKKRKSEDGTISLEACIVVPIFIFLILFIYGFIVMFMGQQMISHSMLQSAESLSIDSYGTEKIRDEDDNPATELVITFMENLFTGSFSADSIDSTFASTKRWYDKDADDYKHGNRNELYEIDKNEVIKNRFLGYLTGESDITKAEEKAKEIYKLIGVENEELDFSESTVEDGVLTMVVKYRQKFVFDFQGLVGIDRRLTIKVNMW